MLLYSEPLNSQHTFMSGPRAGCLLGLGQSFHFPETDPTYLFCPEHHLYFFFFSFLVFYFLNFKIFNSYMRSQT